MSQLESAGSAETHATAARAVSPAWSRAARLSFRLAFCYFIINLFPFPLDYLPYAETILGWYERLWQALVPWVGANILNLAEPITVQPNGSGDTTFNYVQTFCYAALSLAATIVWSIVHAKARTYPRLHYWLMVYIRFALGAILLSYGFAKLFKGQFPTPGPDRLMQPYGSSSPMGLLWTFMGASTAYTFFAGLMEALGGILLFWRRTTTLGALVSAAVMTNVVLLNFCYDVPVKLFSITLLLYSFFLILPDARRLADLLIFNRPTQPASVLQPFARRSLRWSAVTFQHLFILYILASTGYEGYTTEKKYGDDAPKPPLYGLYDAETVTLNGKEVPPLLTEKTRWRRININAWGGLGVLLMDDSKLRYWLEYDEDKKTMILLEWTTKEKAAAFSVAKKENGGLVLEGTIKEDAITAHLKPIPTDNFLLMSRGFHWINEFPFNR